MTDLPDRLWRAMGSRADAPVVVRLLADLGVTWQTRAGPGRANDWIAVENIELGFEFEGDGVEAARSGAAVLRQVCFYRPTDGRGDRAIRPPFGLEYSDTRSRCRQRLGAIASSARLAVRDAFELDGGCLVTQFNDEGSAIETVLAVAHRTERPSKATPPVTFAEIWGCVGRPWHDPALRQRLYALASSANTVAQIQRHGTCSLVREIGMKLLYENDGNAIRLCGVEVYRAGVLDAPAGAHDLPFGVSFTDLPADVERKLGRPPDWRQVSNLQAQAWWRVDDCRLLLTFDLVLNLVSSLTLAKAAYWSPDP